LYVEQPLTVKVLNLNEPPTNVLLPNYTVKENQPVGTTVGTLNTSDPDAGDTASYRLVAGPGSTDNASFTISGNELKTAAVFNFEAKRAYSIRVRVTDQGGLYFEKMKTVDVTNVNERLRTFACRT